MAIFLHSRQEKEVAKKRRIRGKSKSQRNFFNDDFEEVTMTMSGHKAREIEDPAFFTRLSNSSFEW